MTPRHHRPAPPGRAEAHHPGRWALLLAASATVAMAALGWFELGERSFWYDEAYSVGLVDRSLGDALWRIFHWELNQSPFYLVLMAWHALGSSEAFLRSLPVLFAVASVPALFLLGRRLFDPWVGAIAAVLLASHAFFVEWSQQLRAYSLVVLLVIVATHLLVRAVEQATMQRVVAYAAVASLAAYAHFFALLVVAAHLVSLGVLRRPPRRLVTAGAGIGAVLVAPLAWYLLTRQGDPLDWVGQPSGPQLRTAATDLAGGSGVLVALHGLGVLAGVGTVLRGWRRRSAPANWPGILPVLWLSVPVVVTVVSSYTAKPLLVPRFLLVVVPALVLLTAVGIRRMLRPSLVAVAVGVFVVAAVFPLSDWYRQPGLEDWRGATASVLDDADDGDPVVTLPFRAVHAVRYYERRLPGPDIDEGRPDLSVAPTTGQLWEVERAGSAPGGASPERAAYARWRDRHFEPVEERFFKDLTVRRFVRR